MPGVDTPTGLPKSGDSIGSIPMNSQPASPWANYLDHLYNSTSYLLEINFADFGKPTINMPDGVSFTDLIDQNAVSALYSKQDSADKDFTLKSTFAGGWISYSKEQMGVVVLNPADQSSYLHGYYPAQMCLSGQECNRFIFKIHSFVKGKDRVLETMLSLLGISVDCALNWTNKAQFLIGLQGDYSAWNGSKLNFIKTSLLFASGVMHTTAELHYVDAWHSTKPATAHFDFLDSADNADLRASLNFFTPSNIDGTQAIFQYQTDATNGRMINEPALPSILPVMVLIKHCVVDPKLFEFLPEFQTLPAYPNTAAVKAAFRAIALASIGKPLDIGALADAIVQQGLAVPLGDPAMSSDYKSQILQLLNPAA